MRCASEDDVGCRCESEGQRDDQRVADDGKMDLHVQLGRFDNGEDR